MSSRLLSIVIVLFVKFITTPFGVGRKLRTIKKTLVSLRKLMLALDDPINSKLWTPRRLEPDTIEWLNSISTDGTAVLWDIGANVGNYSLRAASSAQVVAFEPQAASYAFLNEAIESAGMDDRIVAYQIAFGSNTKLGMLNQADSDFGASMHGFDTEKDQFGQSIATRFRQGAICFAVDDFVRQFSPLLPTHVKIDVDGLEPDILRGGARTFSDLSVRSMIVELEGSDERLAEIARLMAELGFTAEPKASPDHRNVIFQRPE